MMRDIFDNSRLYFRLLAVALRGQMQYRASFVMLSCATFVTAFTEFLGVWALFDRFGSAQGWSMAEVGLLYGIINVGFPIADGAAAGFDTFPQLVKTGDFDRLLVRPRSTALQVAGREFVPMRVGRLLQGLAVLIWSLSAMQMGLSAPKLLLVLFMIAGYAALFYGLFVLQAIMAFWTVETLEIMNTVTYGGTETAQYPLTIYRPWFRRFFTFVVPLACMNYIPASALFGRPGLSDAPELLRWLAPAVGVLFLVGMLQVWRIGVRHYRSTGS
jgi:ABC-2 type transport system permease protein